MFFVCQNVTKKISISDDDDDDDDVDDELESKPSTYAGLSLLGLRNLFSRFFK